MANKQSSSTAPGSSPQAPQHHLAALLPSQGSVFQLTPRPTPVPGPTDLLIRVHSLALNKIDWAMRTLGLFLTTYPAVIGSDVSGVVVSAGSSVPADAPKPGTRVTAFAPCFFHGGAPDYGAFQEYVLVPAEAVTPLPEGISDNEGSVLPMAVGTMWSAWYSIGLPRETAYGPADKKGLLVWGGASSMGSAAVQGARLMGFTVYTTASEKHHEYLKTLGASRTFDYHDDSVVEKIVSAAKEDGITIDFGYDTVGQLASSLEVLKRCKGPEVAKLASAVPLSEASPKVEGVETRFVQGPVDEEERREFFHFIFAVWLKEKLASGEFVPSPAIKVIEGGLESLDKGLNELMKGVSGVKLVLEI